jgi:CTP:molybdopterin cytidylyltransferase MocA
MDVLVLMAGDSQRFEEAGYGYPKNLVEIDGLALVERVVACLAPLTEAGARLVFVVRRSEADAFHTDEVLRLLVPEAMVVTVPNLESGAACAALLAIEQVDPEQPLLVFNGDQIVAADLNAVVADFGARDLDGGVVVFRAVHPRWSYVRTGPDGLVVEAAEKRPISTLATAGTYYFRRGADFFEAAMAMVRKDAHVQGRFFVCPAFNELVLRQRRVGVHEIDRADYFSLATPQGVSAYEEHLQARRAVPA